MSEQHRDDEIGVYVTNITNGDFIKVRGVDFGGAIRYRASLQVLQAPRMEDRSNSHLDSVDGPEEIGNIACFLHGRVEQMGDEDNDSLQGYRYTRPLLSIPRGRYRPALQLPDYWKFSKKGAKQPKS